MKHIDLIMEDQRQDESRRKAQHLLAKEVVSLVHGANNANKAEAAHKEAFSQGTHTFSLSGLRKSIAEINSTKQEVKESDDLETRLLEYKKQYASSSAPQSATESTTASSKQDTSNIVTLPITLLSEGSFPRVLHAAGLASSSSEGRRLITKRGAYVVLPNSGRPENPYGLSWEQIPEAVSTTDPNEYLIDWEALVLRSGKSKIQICHIVTEEKFEAQGLTCPGWEEFKARRATAEEEGR